MSTRSQYRGATVGRGRGGMSPRVRNSKKCFFQFGTGAWQRTGVANVIR